jgi:hypothetical protein
MDYGHPVQSGVFNTGPAPGRPIGLGAHKPRMLSLIRLAADCWVPSLGYARPADRLVGNQRIDAAAVAAGRDPSAIRRVLKGSADIPVELFTSPTVERGIHTYVIGSLEEVDALRWLGSDVVPVVREAVVAAR